MTLTLVFDTEKALLAILSLLVFFSSLQIIPSKKPGPIPFWSFERPTNSSIADER